MLASQIEAQHMSSLPNVVFSHTKAVILLTPSQMHACAGATLERSLSIRHTSAAVSHKNSPSIVYEETRSRRPEPRIMDPWPLSSASFVEIFHQSGNSSGSVGQIFADHPHVQVPRGMCCLDK